MNRLFYGMINKYILVYFDNILVYHEITNYHKEHFRSVLWWVWEKRLYAKMKKKCEFSNSEVKHLGYVVGSGKLWVEKEKVQSIKDWRAHISIKELNQFLGFAKYYNRLIRSFLI